MTFYRNLNEKLFLGNRNSEKSFGGKMRVQRGVGADDRFPFDFPSFPRKKGKEKIAGSLKYTQNSWSPVSTDDVGRRKL